VSVVAAAALVLGVLAYGIFGGADFGAGFWDLTAGGAARGEAPRQLIDHSLGPVWEANHTWLIYCLVVFWSAFPGAFAAVTTTLYIPLGLAALGIVLRGSGFAFRKVVTGTAHQRAAGAAFAVSSVVTPFFLGAVGGALASGRVPNGGGGDPLRSWWNPTSVFAGALAVAVCAYLAAVFLTADARTAGDERLERWFRRRAWGAAWVTGAFSVAGLAVTSRDASRLFDRLTSDALPAVVVSVAAGLAALVLLRRAEPRLLRVLAAVAVAALVVGWSVAQYPYLLGTHTSVTEAAAPRASLSAVIVIVVAAVVLIGPSFALLYILQQRHRLPG
jgi:cytochrome d ubiquinol oxidase subunit II